MARRASFALVLLAVVCVPVLVLVFGHRFAERGRGLAPGTYLPAGELATLEGRRVHTDSWRGRPTLLVLFSSTCHACERQLSTLIDVAADFPEVRVVLLSLDQASPSFDVPFEVLLDPTGQFVRKSRRFIVPTIYWIDRDGKVLHGRSGLRSPSEDKALLMRFFHGEKR